MLIFVVSNEEQIHYFTSRGKNTCKSYWPIVKITNLSCVSSFITSAFEDTNVVSMNIPEEIIHAIFEYEHYNLMSEHLTIYKYVLQDIEEGIKVILTDHHWHKILYLVKPQNATILKKNCMYNFFVVRRVAFCIFSE